MQDPGTNLFRFERFAIDLDRKILWLGDAPAELPVKAVELLCVLIENEGNVVSKEDLLGRIWAGAFVEEGVLPQNVYLLRKIFKESGSTFDLIQTVPRRGYRFVNPHTDINAEETITIEHEVMEQRFVTETVYSGEAEQPTRPVSRPITVYLAPVVVLIVAIAGIYVLYSRFAAAGSSSYPMQGAGDVRYEHITASGRAFYVGLSPDNQNAAYVVHTPDNRYSLVLYHLPTKSETVIVAPQELHLFNIQFSPDGNYIYYGGAQDTRKTGIFRVPIYGGAGQLITTDPVHHFSISPDGRWLAFYRRVPQEGAHYLEISRAHDGSSRRRIAVRANGSGFSIWGASPSWSPDGRKFVAAAFARPNKDGLPKSELIEIDIATGAQKRIQSPDWHSVHQPYWTAEDIILVMARERIGEPMQIWRLDYPSGKASRITNDSNDYREFRVASDSSFVVAATWSKAENLFLVPVDDPLQSRQLTFDSAGGNGAWGLSWAGNNQILYTRADGYLIGNLWKLDLLTRKSKQLTFDESSRPVGLDVAPDGKSAVFQSNRSGNWHIWRVDLDGGNLRQLTRGPARGSPEVSPDGKWLYFTGDGLWKAPIGGGDPIQIMSNTPGLTRFSPTEPSKFVAHYHDPEEKEQGQWKLALFDESDPLRFIQLTVPATVFEWKPDGTGIYFADNGESFSNIWFVPTNNSAPTRITNFADQKISNFSVSPDGKTFAISRGAAIGNVLRIDLR